MKFTDLPQPLIPVGIHAEAGYPVIWLISWEERRVLEQLALLAARFDPPRQVFIWSTTEGFKNQSQTKGDPITALDFAISYAEPAIFVFKDLHPFTHQHDVVRRLRDVYQQFRGKPKTLIVLSPILSLPPEIEKEITVIDYPLPDIDEVEKILNAEIKNRANATLSLSNEEREAMLRSFLGLTADEIAAVARKVLLRRDVIDINMLDELVEEKRLILRKTEILDFIPTDIKMSHVGGLGRFKRWANTRANGFTKEAREFGLPMPKGVLITGISGCGKSLIIQALANAWHLPLLRLDMGRVFSGFAGTPEESLRRAIFTVEAVAPSILWVDEIEMGISVFSDSVESGATARIFASFLTWMQEKRKAVFIAATANDIDRLPPEFIRKGRFDEIFFVDLPSQEEREEVITIHLERHGKTASIVSIEGLAKRAAGYTGAEIEQAIVSGMYEAFAEKRELSINDIYRALGNMVPLSVTMKEQITKTKRWADNRAIKAS